MNTCLSALYLKLSQLDSRYFRLVIIVVALAASRGFVLGLPIGGDVSG
jgi:hypothetical protein